MKHLAYKNIEDRRAYARKHYAANKQAYIDRSAIHTAKVRKETFEILARLKSVPCMDCGKTFPTCCMDFDHVDPGTKTLAVSQAVRQGWSVERVLEEVDKCEVVCANCHRIRTQEQAMARFI